MAFYNELLNELKTLNIVDAHEHLGPEESPPEVARDFSMLFKHYTPNDLNAAGAAKDELLAGGQGEALAGLFDGAIPQEERWAHLEPFYNAIKFTGYGRMVVRVVRGLLGFPDLNADTLKGVSDAIKALNGPGRYDKVLRGRCNLAACVQCWILDQPHAGHDLFFHLAPGPVLIDLFNREALRDLETRSALKVRRLEDAVSASEKIIAGWAAEERVVGVKIAHAYSRPIDFKPRSPAEAQEVFRRLRNLPGAQSLSFAEALPLQDYMVFEIARICEANDFPLVVHTGIQAGNRNRLSMTHPLGLEVLLENHPELKLDIFHGGMPWFREVAMLARYFPGVHLNMAWMHIINPAQARAALADWLDGVPATKIFGFGGDLAEAELVYGHLDIALNNIARVLADKVVEETMDEDEARHVAAGLLYDNPNRFYGLGLK